MPYGPKPTKLPPTKPKPGMQSRWDDTCLKIRSGEEKLYFGWHETSVTGLFAIEAKTEKGACPLGWVWYRHECGNVICIALSFTNETVRRCGIRTAIHKQMLEWYPETRMIVTGRATDFSLPWLKKMGFVFNKDFDRWELAVTPPKKKKKAP